MANELILIVEDNPKNLKLVRDTLQVKGYQTIETETGEEGRLPSRTAGRSGDASVLSVAEQRAAPVARVQSVFHRVRRGELGPRVSAGVAYAFDSLRR